MGAGFTVNNPNAVAACGCGSSFRTADDAGAPELRPLDPPLLLNEAAGPPAASYPGSRDRAASGAP